MNLILKGVILGAVIILPGMSGGTILLILGLYEKMIKDVVNLNIKPYLPLVYGAVMGIFVSSMLFGFFFESHRNATLAFLFGCLLASIRPVLSNCPKLDIIRGIFLIGGLLIGFFAVGEPIELIAEKADEANINWILLIIGGALASAAMIIPGIPGSSVLILFGIYDSILVYVREFAIIPLLVFGVSSLIGIATLVKLMDTIYSKYKASVSYLFAGIILGSARSALPGEVDFVVVATFVVAFGLVWLLGKEKVNLREQDTQ